MTSHDYITFSSSPSFRSHPATLEASIDRPHYPERRNPVAQNEIMREIIRSWGGVPTTPPGCRAVSFSSWTRFSAKHRTKSSEEMKASILCAAAGTTPDYDPPLLERTYLGVDQTPHSVNPEKKDAYYRRHHIRKQACRNDARTSSNSPCGSREALGPITFRKEVVRKAPTNSLLTRSLSSQSSVDTEGQHPRITVDMAKEFGIKELSTSALSDVFGSDEEDSFIRPPPTVFKARVQLFTEDGTRECGRVYEQENLATRIGVGW